MARDVPLFRPSFLFANGTEDRLLTAVRPNTELAMVAVRDFGVAVATAIEHPYRFDRVELELAGDRSSMKKIPAVLSGATCVVRKDHPIVRRVLDLQASLALQHLLVSPEGDRFGHADVALAERGLKRPLAVTLTQMYAAPAVGAGSDLMAGVVEMSG